MSGKLFPVTRGYPAPVLTSVIPQPRVCLAQPAHTNLPSERQQRGASTSCRATIMREVLSNSMRQKVDPSDDSQFYEFPRFVNHVDDNFLKQVTQLYKERIPENGAVLDLMSSHVSHLPRDKKYSNVIGHGMNGQELAKNPQLKSWFVRNLNMQPNGWDIEDATLDAVVCCVSVQYMQQPEKVFAEIYRVLKPGGVCIMSFSNRMFYTKAVRAWTENSEYGRVSLVQQYFQCIDGFTTPEVVKKIESDEQDEPKQGLEALLAQFQGIAPRDPLFAVIAYRDQKPGQA